MHDAMIAAAGEFDGEVFIAEDLWPIAGLFPGRARQCHNQIYICNDMHFLL